MTEPRPGRRPQRFAIRRLRLVNFHNLVDETIEIPDAGHLFLLGDNGSGKTTVLDAIHLALTGSLDVELNAAARVSGGRDAGRTLQGIVLRYDAEHGIVNEGGAIAYAMIELLDETDGAVLCAGVGIEATTMDADVGRWAVLHRGPLEAVPLVTDGPGGRIPSSREALRAALGKLDVPARMSDYRKALAERLFGGEALYEEVCRFWRMAKAYREIVSSARDFASLFFRLLPAPDAVVFEEILRSLRALDELDGLVEQLERQRRYVADVSALVEEIRGRREEGARYRWLIAFRQHAEALARKAREAAALEERERELQRSAAEVAEKRGVAAVAAEDVRAASERDPDGLLGRLRAAEAQHERLAGESERAAASLHDLEAQLDVCEAEARSALGRRSEIWRRQLLALSGAIEGARTLEHPFVRVVEVLEHERDLSEQPGGLEVPPPLPPLDERAATETVEATRAAERRLREREGEQARASADLAEARATLDRLLTVREEAPAVAGFLAARAALVGLPATPLFELLEPRPAANEDDLAALEALLGDATLAAFITDPEHLAAVRARALPHPSIRVVVRTAGDARPPPWIADLFSNRTPPVALEVLGTLLSQAASLGVIRPPDALGDVEHRGAAARPSGESPRLIGTDARRQAHEQRLRSARGGVAEAETSLAASTGASSAAAGAHSAVVSVREALDGLREREIIEAHASFQHRSLERVHAGTNTENARTRLFAVQSQSEQALALVEALRARVRETGIEELESRLGRLRALEKEAVTGLEAAVERHAEAKAGLSAAAVALRECEAEIERHAERLRLDAAALREALGPSGAAADDAGLERYVRVDKRGNQFKSIETIDAAHRDAERQEAAACREIEGDGSRGVSNLEWAGRFGFTWSSAALRVEDRRGEPIASVLIDLEKKLTEQREVVNERTRELMDRLVMGDLARELQDQVERLHRTVKEMNDLLDGLRFGSTRYQFRVTPRAEVAELVGIVRKLSLLDESSRVRFREFVDARLEEVRRFDREVEVPELLDYRRWFEYRLSMRSTGAGETELTRELRALGSGGEQGVPNYLLVLALAKLMFDNAEARVRPLLFDEAFYGIDAGRRDQLLRFATELGLQLVIASPDQDGVTPSARRTTTLFLVKDTHGDVHLAPYHYWNDATTAQPTLFPERPVEPDAADAICTVGE